VTAYLCRFLEVGFEILGQTLFGSGPEKRGVAKAKRPPSTIQNKEPAMVRLSVLVEGAHGLTWDRWKEFVSNVEKMGYAGLYGSDHFTLVAGPPDPDSLELIVSLAYAADHTERLKLG